ncbi:hypothetical protein ACFWN5_19630 [Streptomyces sp. NPDC058430]|uniref:hypothetical protein n=1 Tax=Streptomyces sp. NPDC058430 TaxID=3346495 RepID=UPI00364F0298
MEIARLVLDFLKILVWPGVAITALLCFRHQIRELSSRVTRVNILGNELEAAVRGASEAVEDALDSLPAVDETDQNSSITGWLNPLAVTVADEATNRAFDAVNALERTLRRCAFEVDETLVGRTTNNITNELVERQLLPPSTRMTVAELLAIRDSSNRHLHEQDAVRMLRTAQQMLLLVQLARSSHVPQRAGVPAET